MKSSLDTKRISKGTGTVVIDTFKSHVPDTQRQKVEMMQ